MPGERSTRSTLGDGETDVNEGAASDHPDIGIVGGGICGLTTAIALERRGISPTVYEAASTYEPVGAGILLQTNAMLVYDRLGLAERIRDAGISLTMSGLRSLSGDFMTRFELAEVERDEFGYGFVSIHRADLQRILLQELDTDVLTGKDCVEVDGTEPPTVHFDDGTRVSPDVLIGADGIHSTVRDTVAPGVGPRDFDGIVYRAVVDVDLPGPYQTQGFEVWGPGTATGGAPIDEDRFYWFATAPDPVHDSRAAPEERLAALRTYLSGYPEPIPRILGAIKPADVFVTDLEDLPPLESWSRGRVVLAGDSAHAMLPFAGQGAAQAIEDGLALAEAIVSNDGHKEAFDVYERQRRTRADTVRRESYRLSQLGMIQSGLGSRLRNSLIEAVPDSLMRRRRRRRAAGTTLPG